MLKNYLTRTNLVPMACLPLDKGNADSGNEIGLAVSLVRVVGAKRGRKEAKSAEEKRKRLHRLPVSENPSRRLEGVPWNQ